MTVAELIAELQKCDPEALVVLSRDQEGNGYAECAQVDGENRAYLDHPWHGGGVKFAKLTPELERQGYIDEDCAGYIEEEGGKPHPAVPCVVLWP